MNSSSAFIIIRCLGENSDESLVRIYSEKIENKLTKYEFPRMGIHTSFFVEIFVLAYDHQKGFYV